MLGTRCCKQLHTIWFKTLILFHITRKHFVGTWVIIYGLQVLLFSFTLWPTSTTSISFYLHLCQNNNWELLQYQSGGIWKIFQCLSHFCWYWTPESLIHTGISVFLGDRINHVTLSSSLSALQRCSELTHSTSVKICRDALIGSSGEAVNCSLVLRASVTVWHMPAADTQPRGNSNTS